MHHPALRRSLHGGLPLALAVLLLPLLPLAAFILFPDLFTKYIPFFEKSPPDLEFVQKPEALGLGNNRLELRVHDKGAGIDEITVRAEQQGRSYDLFRQSFPRPKPLNQEVAIDFNPKELGMREDAVRIKASVFDGSFWSNGAEEQFSSRIIYSRPRVEVLTSQHNVSQGGAGLVFYRIISGEIRESGIRVGEKEFIGFPASLLGQEFKSDPAVHFALFGVPKDFKSPPLKMQVFARDIGGNEALAPMYFRVRNVALRSAPIKLTTEFLADKVPELLPKHFAEIGTQPPSNGNSSDPQALSEGFKVINESQRAINDKRIRTALKDTAKERLWEGTFNRAVMGSPTSSYGEQRSYSFNGREISRSSHDGIDLAAVANTVVRAANSGRVVFAEELGIYGNTVLIDHGFGLSTLYGHLSSITVAVGDRVAKDDQIGRSGMTGLAGGDHLHFEVRLQGEPVTPIEWWDTRWIREHIDERILSMAAGSDGL